jgi:hypothetical protein
VCVCVCVCVCGGGGGGGKCGGVCGLVFLCEGGGRGHQLGRAIIKKDEVVVLVREWTTQEYDRDIHVKLVQKNRGTIISRFGSA